MESQQRAVTDSDYLQSWSCFAPKNLIRTQELETPNASEIEGKGGVEKLKCVKSFYKK